MATWPYNRDKFRELVLLIAERCADDSAFGDTHMNKVLFFSDAYALQYLGQPITGAKYQKLPYGPAARALVPVRTAMQAAGEVEVEKIGKRRVTRARREPNLALFSDDELKLIERVIERFAGRRAGEISDESHKLSAGWRLVELKEDIPLGTQMLDTAPITATTRRRVERFAARYGW